MEIGKTLYVHQRKQWRSWLSKHYRQEKEIWLVFYKKDSGKKRISYVDAVEEALCYGWIDSIVKKRDAESFVQRFSPRKPKSVLSELNRERIRRLIRQKKMTKAGLLSIAHHLSSRKRQPKRFVLPADILAEIKKSPAAWRHFQKFPASYRNIRIAWIDGSRNRSDVFRRRLAYFIAMSEKNKQFGMMR